MQRPEPIKVFYAQTNVFTASNVAGLHEALWPYEVDVFDETGEVVTASDEPLKVSIHCGDAGLAAQHPGVGGR